MHKTSTGAFNEFLESLVSNERDTVRNGFKKLCDYYDVPVFALSSVCHYDPLKNFDVFHNYPPQWVKEYKLKGYCSIDPVHKRAQSSVIPFCWDESFLRNADPLNHEFIERAKHFEILKGYTVPLIKDHLQSHMLTILNVKFLHPEVIYYISTAAIAYVKSYKRNSLINYEVALSPRETLVQELAARGNNIKSISESLGISMATVIFHINNAKRKLKANSMNQALYLFGKNIQLQGA